MGDVPAIDKQARIIHRPDDKDYLEPVRQHVRMWADWRKSDLPPELGYPSQSAEQSDMTGGARTLPGWVIELTLDGQIMCVMKPELRRAILACYNVPVRESEAKDAGCIVKKLIYMPQANKFRWPTDMGQAAEAAAMKKPTLYAQLSRALYWIDGKFS